MEALQINNTTKINNYKEVDKLELSTITRNDGDKELLSGLILYGYEMKFGKVNENMEVFQKDCLNDFLNDYFIKNKLNIPVTVLHRGDLTHLAGRVLVVEVNGIGFYFVVYVPKSYMHYQALLDNIKEGILQGFSKEGWATEYENMHKTNGDFDYTLIKKMAFDKLSIVATPANGVKFEKIAETKIKNATQFINNQKKQETIDDLLFTKK